MAIGWTDTIDWQIRGRAGACARTGRGFDEGDWVYTLLHRDGNAFRREDICEEAWRQLGSGGALAAFCFWRARYRPPPPPPPEPVKRVCAEDLLRRLACGGGERARNARYVLALMLERRRVLRQVDVRPADEGRVLVYEHGVTGEVFLVPEPNLHLDQLSDVQAEVIDLLESGGETPAPETGTGKAPGDGPGDPTAASAGGELDAL